MASISKEPNGRRTIQFVGADGKRRSIRLGKVSQRTAEAVKVKVEALNAAVITGQVPDDEVSRWLSSLDAAMVDRLAAAGLVPRRASATIGDFVESYIDSRNADAKPNTLLSFRTAKQHLVGYFGRDKRMKGITLGDVDDYRRHLLADHADSSVNLFLRLARQFFRAAARKGLIRENPFTGVPCGVRVNRDRFHYVSMADYQAVLGACPSLEWRVLVGLARIGGLRVPSESGGLEWSNVDWERARLLVHAPKLERHSGRADRWVPLFPGLRELLEQAWAAAPEGSVYLLPTLRMAKNLRPNFQTIIRRAGLTVWEKPFINCRASRATELATEYPGFVAAAWLGHTERIADAHYRHTLESHFEAAARSGADSGAQAVQIPVQQPAAGNRQESLGSCGVSGNKGLLPACTVPREIVQTPHLFPAVIDPDYAKPCSKRASGYSPIPSGAESGALAARNPTSDPDLRAVIAAWPTLPAAAKAGIVAMVRAARGGDPANRLDGGQKGE